jgi:hypothetical protein
MIANRGHIFGRWLLQTLDEAVKPCKRQTFWLVSPECQRWWAKRFYNLDVRKKFCGHKLTLKKGRRSRHRFENERDLFSRQAWFPTDKCNFLVNHLLKVSNESWIKKIYCSVFYRAIKFHKLQATENNS